MISLDLHQYTDRLKTKNKNGTVFVFDPIRKKDLVLQPEELVRQLLIQHLIFLGYPKEKIQVEKSLSFNGIKKRFDIVVFNRLVQPFLLIECKSHKIAITQEVFDQIAFYNLALKAPYLLISNGIETHSCQINFDTKAVIHLDEIPIYLP